MRTSSLLIGLAALAFLALAVMASSSASADKMFDDWTVSSDETHQDEQISVTGSLTVGSRVELTLINTTVTFLGRTPDATVATVMGKLTLWDSSLVSVLPGRLRVEQLGILHITGVSRIDAIDVLVDRMRDVSVFNAQLTLEGMNPDNPMHLDSFGSIRITSSEVVLDHALVMSRGTFSIDTSQMDASADFGHVYPDTVHRVKLLGGKVTLKNSQFKDLRHGIFVSVDAAVTDCTFTRADLVVVPHSGLIEMDSEVLNSSFRESSLLVRVDDRPGDLQLRLTLEGLDIDDGKLELVLDEVWSGEIDILHTSVDSSREFAVDIQSAGFNGYIAIWNLSIQAPYGISLRGEFSKTVMKEITVDAEETALDIAGRRTSVPIAHIEDLTVVKGREGIRVRDASLYVSFSDLLGATVPIVGRDNSTTTLLNTKLDERNATLDARSPGSFAQLLIERYLSFTTVGWLGGEPFTEGTVELEAVNKSAGAWAFSEWEIGDPLSTPVRKLEWTRIRDTSGDLDNSYIEFHEVNPYYEVQEHRFTIEDPIDPWDDGPFALLFIDHVDPWIHLDLPIRYTAGPTSVWVPLIGECGDVGMGLSEIRWVLIAQNRDEVSNGTIDWLEGRWDSTIPLTGNYQIVRIEAWDRAGNLGFVETSAIEVDVPPPTLTLQSPRDGEVTNNPMVPIIGSVSGGYANEVQVLIRAGTTYQEVDRVSIVDGWFSTVIELQREGIADIVLVSRDPYGNSIEKPLSVHLDTTPPSLSFVGLSKTEVNYVTTSSLVIEGRTDDDKAKIKVQGQVVGVLDDRSFATTVQLVEGEQEVRVEARDTAGNDRFVDITVVLDTIAPELMLIRPDSATFYTNKESVVVEVAPSETLSKLVQDGLRVTLVDGRHLIDVVLRDDGTRAIEFLAYDLAGNEGRLVVTIVRDTEPPVLTVMSPQQNAILNKRVIDLIARVSENGCQLLADGTTLDYETKGSGQLVASLVIGVGDGLHEISIKAVDRAGNSDVVLLNLDIDTTRPFIHVEGLADGSKVTTEPLEVRGSTEADAHVVWVNDVRADLHPDGSFKAVIRLSEGTQTIVVRAVDRAKNEKEETIEVQVLKAPDWELEWETAAAITIVLALGALIGSTEVGRWSLLLMWLPLYTKLRKDKILDQQTRGLIQGYITANPGCNYTLIRDNLELADGTLTYHLQVLEREGFIYSIREGLFRCFYPKGVPPPRRGKLHLSDTQMDIVRMCKRIPGITVGEIATAMNRRANVISYHLKLLKEGGLIRLEEDGRHVRVYPVDSAVAMI
jgi:predicted transcriptional regulator